MTWNLFIYTLKHTIILLGTLAAAREPLKSNFNTENSESPLILSPHASQMCSPSCRVSGKMLLWITSFWGQVNNGVTSIWATVLLQNSWTILPTDRMPGKSFILEQVHPEKNKNKTKHISREHQTLRPMGAQRVPGRRQEWNILRVERMDALTHSWIGSHFSSFSF